MGGVMSSFFCVLTSRHGVSYLSFFHFSIEVRGPSLAFC
jgi:hypothetical protein